MGERRVKYLVKSWDDRSQCYDLQPMWLEPGRKIGSAFWIKNKRYEIIDIYE